MFLEAALKATVMRDESARPLTVADLLGESGRRSSSGVIINNESALANPFVYRGVNMITADVAKLPVWVYQREGDGSRQQLRNHPVSRALNIRSNPTTKPTSFIRTLLGHALLHRGGYAEISRAANGRIEMDVLDPRRTHPVEVEGRGLFYQTFDGGTGVDRLIAAENVFHVRGLGFDTIDSYSVLDKLKEALGLGLAQQTYASVFFRNNAQPKLVITFPGQLKTEGAVERFRNSWGNTHGGVQNSHKPAILEGGADINTITPNAKETQLLELRQLDRQIVATILGLPPHKLGDPERSSFASLEHENQSYLDQAIDPWLREFESESNFKLLPNQFPDRFTEFNREALIRMNFADKMSGFNTAISAGFMNRNEVRRKLNMNDADGLDDFLVPLNVVIVGEEPPEPSQPLPAPEPDDDDEEEEDGRFQRMVAQMLDRMVQRVVMDANRAVRKQQVDQWLESELLDKHLDVWVREFSPVCGEIKARDVAETTFSEIRNELARCERSEAVRQITNSYLTDLPPRLAAQLWGPSNGTPLLTT